MWPISFLNLYIFLLVASCRICFERSNLVANSKSINQKYIFLFPLNFFFVSFYWTILMNNYRVINRTALVDWANATITRMIWIHVWSALLLFFILSRPLLIRFTVPHIYKLNAFSLNFICLRAFFALFFPFFGCAHFIYNFGNSANRSNVCAFLILSSSNQFLIFASKSIQQFFFCTSVAFLCLVVRMFCVSATHN